MGAGLRSITEKFIALIRKSLHRHLDIVNLKADVMDSRTLAVQKAGDRGVGFGRFEKFEARVSRRNEGNSDTLFGDRLGGLDLESEATVQLGRLLDRGDRDSHVIQLQVVVHGLSLHSHHMTTTRRTQTVLQLLECAQDLASDHESLNFGRALANRAELGVAPGSLHGIVLGVAIAAVDLHSFFSDLDGSL